MASWKQQALIEAPVEVVWSVLCDPSRFPDWNPDTIEVTGPPTRIEKGATFEQTSSTPLGMKTTTTYAVTELDELREVKLQCQVSGYYSHWWLTEARGSTFAEVEMGVEPPRLLAQAFKLPYNKRFLRRITDQALDNLRRFVRRGQAGR